MNLTTALNIQLQLKDQRIARVHIASARPVQATAKLLQGKTVAEVIQTVPLLLNVCAKAQAVAAVRACEQALQVSASQTSENMREMLVDTERLKEHVYHILVDWPGILQCSPEPGLLQQLGQSLRLMESGLDAGNILQPGAQVHRVNSEAFMQGLITLQHLVETAILGCTLNDSEARIYSENKNSWLDWIDHTDTQAARLLHRVIDERWGRGSHTRVLPLPALCEKALGKILLSDNADQFAACPVWAGQVYETSVYTRQQQLPLIAALQSEHWCARLSARLCEMVILFADLKKRLSALTNNAVEKNMSVTESVQSADLTPSHGVAQVDAARGKLIHLVKLSHQRVSDYQIVAPTEWNFHPQGAVVSGLEGVRVDCEEHARQQANLFIRSIDPCTGFQLSVVCH